MPRENRIMGDDIHYHIIQRCNNKERLLKEGKDFEMLLEMLGEAKKKFCFRLYNYEFLNAHIHLMLSTHQNGFIDKIMHDLCLKYAKDYNQRYKRTGHFWAHRYRSRIILDERHGLACLRYQHRNAVSAGIVFKPEDWPWSGYAYYAYGTPDDLLEPHPCYLTLHEGPVNRRQVYRELVNTPVPADKCPNVIEKGSGRLTQRFLKLVNQVDGLRKQINSPSSLHMVPGTI